MPRALLLLTPGFTLCLAQGAHGKLRSEIDETVQPQSHRHTTHEASARSMLVGLRAALIGEHVKGMLESLDSSFPPAQPTQEGT